MKITLAIELDQYDSPTTERGGRHMATTLTRSVDMVTDGTTTRWEPQIKRTTDMLAAAVTDALLALEDSSVKA